MSVPGPFLVHLKYFYLAEATSAYQGQSQYLHLHGSWKLTITELHTATLWTKRSGQELFIAAYCVGRSKGQRGHYFRYRLFYPL